MAQNFNLVTNSIKQIQTALFDLGCKSDVSILIAIPSDEYILVLANRWFSIINSKWSISHVQVHWNQSETTCCGQGQFPTMQLKSTSLHNFCQIIFWYKTIYNFHNMESERLAWIPCFTNSGFVVKCKKRFDIVLMGIEARWEIIEYYMMK